MCSYNAVNGVPSCANNLLQNIVARDQWDFDGYFVSDCGAINDIQYSHNYTNNVWDTCAVAIKGGCDLNCGSYYLQCGDAIKHETLDIEDLRDAVGRVMKTRFELGLFDPPQFSLYNSLEYYNNVGTYEHSELAYRAALESMVLLQNNNNILPLNSSSIKNIALIGPNANATTTLLGDYYGTPKFVISPLQGFLKYTQVQYTEGCSIQGNDTSGFDYAINIAKNSDAVVFVAGIDQSVESEGLDRTSITLPGVQLELIQQIVGNVTDVPIIVMLVNGGQISIPWIKENVDGIVECFYPGMAGGRAMADIVFGAYNPGGRLPYTIYPPDYVNEIPMTDMTMRDYPGQTYKFYTGNPVFEFGHGLSYTTFEYTPITSQTIYASTLDKEIYYRVNVTNTGNMEGDDVVLGFVYPNAEDAPFKKLFGFERIHLNPGETKEVYFFQSVGTLALYNKLGYSYIKPGMKNIKIGKLDFELHLEGEEILYSKPVQK
eukprot:TRINITY_DN3243_c0_g2_i1.p1 TRINITY_DN3243_c0_g2~~TRINITY_DN3243_c0_g2_i1.p1  ORF type:complete len:488 (+),score=165.70 TRINITY_DN3243_c0_g2_i1:127-1590(+)